MGAYQEGRIHDIIAGPRAFRIVDFPGTEKLDEPVKVAVRCLTESRLDMCRAEAQRIVRERAKKMHVTPESFMDLDPEFFQRLVHRQILLESFFDADTIDGEDPQPFFSDSADIAELDSVTVKALCDVYYEHQQWVSPLQQADAEELAEKLGKASSVEVVLSGYERNTLVSLCASLACRVRSMTSPSGKSSTS